MIYVGLNNKPVTLDSVITDATKYGVGDIRESVSNNLNDDYLLCNGGIVDIDTYPVLYKMLQSNEFDTWVSFNSKINTVGTSNIIYARGYYWLCTQTTICYSKDFAQEATIIQVNTSEINFLSRIYFENNTLFAVGSDNSSNRIAFCIIAEDNTLSYVHPSVYIYAYQAYNMLKFKNGYSSTTHGNDISYYRLNSTDLSSNQWYQCGQTISRINNFYNNTPIMACNDKFLIKKGNSGKILISEDGENFETLLTHDMVSRSHAYMYLNGEFYCLSTGSSSLAGVWKIDVNTKSCSQIYSISNIHNYNNLWNIYWAAPTSDGTWYAFCSADNTQDHGYLVNLTSQQALLTGKLYLDFNINYNAIISDSRIFVSNSATAILKDAILPSIATTSASSTKTYFYIKAK